MGTRSLTIITDEKGRDLVCMYRQFDGYYDGHGKDLADFLSGFSIVNGMTGKEPNKFANGMGCLAAQIISHFKQKPGSIYIYPVEARNVGEEYVYIVSGNTGKEPVIAVDEFTGPASSFNEFIKSQQTDE